jgi:hypothetical protein
VKNNIWLQNNYKYIFENKPIKTLFFLEKRDTQNYILLCGKKIESFKLQKMIIKVTDKEIKSTVVRMKRMKKKTVLPKQLKKSCIGQSHKVKKDMEQSKFKHWSK